MTATAFRAETPPLALQQDPGTPQPRSYLVVQRIADRFGPQVAASYVAAVTGLRGSIDEAALRAAIASGNIAAIEATAGADRLARLLANADFDRTMIRTATVTGEAGAQMLESATGFATRFNSVDAATVMFARERSAQLVVRVGGDVKEAIRVVVAIGAEHGLTTAQQARAIREVVGLPSNWAAAPSNFANELRTGVFNKSRLLHDPLLPPAQRAGMRRRVVAEIEAGIAAGQHTDPAWVARQQAAYSRNLLHRRARNIARTESIGAAHAGQHAGWKQAIEQGVLPDNVRRFVVVTPDDRLEHWMVPSMNEGGRAIDEPFDAPEGTFMHPPFRTSCRCGVALGFPGQPGML